MRRALAAAVLVAALGASGCTKTTGKVVMGVGGAVLAGTVISFGVRDCSAAENDPGACERPRAEAVVLFPAIAVTVAGFLIYAIADPPPPEQKPAPDLRLAEVPPPAPPPPPDPVDLTERARYAARAGQCEAVVRLSARVAELDGAYHARSFVTDASIARCLAQATVPGQPGGQ